jgi:glyoxylase-like metal-dependent hydrolase (beta-lactamase superfamily II)
MSASVGVVHHLNCGTMCPHGARLLAGEGGLLASATLVCHCLLLEGADGLTLIDTGFGSDDVRNPRQLGTPFRLLTRPRLDTAETALAQIRALGLDPADVRDIVTTHLDLDHAGGLPDFPAADVHVMQAEHDAAMKPSLRERLRYISKHWSHGPRWITHGTGGDDWMGMEGIRILPGSDAEVLLIPLAGHTVGHTGVAIRRADGWLLHCGDAYFHQGEVRTPPSCPPGLRVFESLNDIDGTGRRRNQERLRELAERHRGEVELICSHDASTLDPGAREPLAAAAATGGG